MVWKVVPAAYLGIGVLWRVVSAAFVAIRICGEGRSSDAKAFPKGERGEVRHCCESGGSGVAWGAARGGDGENSKEKGDIDQAFDAIRRSRGPQCRAIYGSPG